MADAIAASGYDAVALEEVWDEDAKGILASKLGPLYPYHADHFGSAIGSLVSTCPYTLGFSQLEDSGLMIFSKFPFERFRLSPSSPKVGSAFARFGACSGIDCCAQKGVALVVLRPSDQRQRYVLAVTHLQNNDDDKDRSYIRSLQLGQVQDLIRQIMATNFSDDYRRAEVFLVGDLNIAGHVLPDHNPMSGAGTGSEWQEQFWEPASFFRFPMYDTWAWTTSAFDPGATSSGRERIDYILHDRDVRPSDFFCVQHLTKAFRG